MDDTFLFIMSLIICCTYFKCESYAEHQQVKELKFQCKEWKTKGAVSE